MKELEGTIKTSYRDVELVQDGEEEPIDLILVLAEYKGKRVRIRIEELPEKRNGRLREM